MTEVLDNMYKCKSFSLYNLECSPYYWLIQTEESFINSSLLLLLMKVLQHLKISITINENKIYLQCLDLRHTCTKGFDPGEQQICQQHLFSLPIICKANYKLTFRSLEAMDWVPLRLAWTAEYIRSWKQFSSNTLKWHRITLTPQFRF